MEMIQHQHQQGKKIKFNDFLRILDLDQTKKYSISKDSPSPSGTAKGYCIFAFYCDGLRLKYYPIVTKELRCMAIVRRVKA